MAAVLCGDHVKDTFPHKLVENMTVSNGVEYVQNAFKKFLDECEKHNQNGDDGSTIVVKNNATTKEVSTNIINKSEEPTKEKSKSFAAKFFSCIVCNHH